MMEEWKNKEFSVDKCGSVGSALPPKQYMAKSEQRRQGKHSKQRNQRNQRNQRSQRKQIYNDITM